MAKSSLLLKTAAITAKSSAGSSVFIPPVMFRKTSFAPNVINPFHCFPPKEKKPAQKNGQRAEA
jgi:hypothetical protein